MLALDGPLPGQPSLSEYALGMASILGALMSESLMLNMQEHYFFDKHRMSRVRCAAAVGVSFPQSSTPAWNVGLSFRVLVCLLLRVFTLQWQPLRGLIAPMLCCLGLHTRIPLLAHNCLPQLP